MHAVDAAGVHPLLFAIGSERYTPYQQLKQPAELLTIANRVLGTGQLSLAKYLFITAEEDRPVSTHDIPDFLMYILERINLHRDIHFQTNTTIDTLDYSGTGINTGSKVVFAAVGDKKRNLCTEVPVALTSVEGFGEAKLVLPGIVALQAPAFTTYEDTELEMQRLSAAVEAKGPLAECPMIILCDDSGFISEELNNFLWATFTRSNPSHDIYGVNSRTVHKHWSCDNVIIDARVKPHQAPPLIPDPDVQRNIERVFAQGGSLSGIRK